MTLLLKIYVNELIYCRYITNDFLSWKNLIIKSYTLMYVVFSNIFLKIYDKNLWVIVLLSYMFSSVVGFQAHTFYYKMLYLTIIFYLVKGISRLRFYLATPYLSMTFFWMCAFVIMHLFKKKFKCFVLSDFFI